jgi:aspartate/methionine/tyrosine aminotransferase
VGRAQSPPNSSSGRSATAAIESAWRTCGAAWQSDAERSPGELQGLGVLPWTLPPGGFYLWCRLPDGRDAAEVAKAALRERLVLAPGNAFSVTQSHTDLMRFNVAQMNAEALRILGHLLR